MIRDKSEFLFVTQNALANITIDGKPYPVREQKLILRGEDIADLEEGVRERLFFYDHTGLVGEGNTPSLRYSLVYLSQYDERILEVHDEVIDYYNRIKSALNGRRWMNATKEDAITTNNPLVRCEGRYDYNDYHAKLQYINGTMIPAYDQSVTQRTSQHMQTLSGLETNYNSAVATENARFADDPAISAAEAAYNQALTAAETKKKDDTDAEDKAHNANLAAIEKRYKDGAIDGAERDRQIAAEDDRHTLEVNVINNTYADTVENATTTKDVAVTRATDTHYATLNTLKTNYDKAVADEGKDYAADLNRLRDGLDSSIYEYANSNPSFAKFLFDNSYCPAMREREDAFQAARITQSCADAFYRRDPLFKYASTPLNRLFADLEHMNARMDGTTPTFYRAAHTYQYSNLPTSYRDNEEAFTDLITIRTIFMDDGDASGVYSNTDFYFLFGARYEIGQIEAVYADVVIERNDSKNNGEGNPSSNNNTYSIVRTRFQYQGIINESELSSVDRLSDSFAEEKAGLLSTRDAAYAAAEEDYDDAVAEAQGAYDAAVGQAAATRDGAIAAAKLDCVRTLYEDAPEVNTKVVAAEAAGNEDEKRRVLTQFGREVSSQNRQMEEAIRSAESTYEYAEYEARVARTAAIRTAAVARTEARGAANTAYSNSLRQLQERYDGLLEQIVDSHNAQTTTVEQAYTSAINAANSVRSEKVNAAASEAYNEMERSFGPPDYYNPDSSWRLELASGYYTIIVGRAASQYMKNKGDELNATLSQKQYEANQEYDAAKAAAEQTRWNGLKDIYPLDPMRRGRFVASISPADACAYSGDGVTQWVSVVGVRNFEVRYNPRMVTGADFSKYYEELG